MYGTPEQLFSTVQPLSGVVTNNTILHNIVDTSFGISKPVRDIWYTIKDGNWNDPTIWRTVRGYRKDWPTLAGGVDDVYIKHTIAMNVTAVSVNNLCVSGVLNVGGFNFTVLGNIQATGAVNVTSVSGNLILWGNNNYISNGSFAVGNFTYSRNGDQVILPLAYNTLTIANSNVRCTKYLTSNIVVGGNFAMSNGISLSPVTFECGIYDFTVNGTISIASFCFFSKSGPGNILIIGGTAWINSGLNLSGNPTVEFRSGFSVAGTFTFNSGTGLWKFTTNNQSLATANVFVTFNCPILVSGAITLSLTTAATFGGIFLGAIDGDNAGSTLDNRAITHYRSPTQPMVTGVFVINAAANTWHYSLNGNQDVTGGTYSSLTLSTGGVKKLQGNVSVVATYTLSAPATKDNNGFTFGNP